MMNMMRRMKRNMKEGTKRERNQVMVALSSMKQVSSTYFSGEILIREMVNCSVTATATYI